MISRPSLRAHVSGAIGEIPTRANAREGETCRAGDESETRSSADEVHRADHVRSSLFKRRGDA